MKLVRISLESGYDCRPSIRFTSYEDEADGGMVYRDRENRSRKQMVKVGEPWIEYDGAAKTPYWNVYCIMGADASSEDMKKYVEDMYKALIDVVKWNSVSFIQRVEQMSVPSENEILSMVKAGMDMSCGMTIHDFIDAVKSKALLTGKAEASSAGSDPGKFEEYFAGHVSDSVITAIVNEISVFHVNGDYIMFGSDNQRASSINVVANKLGKDAYDRYCEENGSV